MQRCTAPLVASMLVAIGANADIIHSGSISQVVGSDGSFQFEIAGETFEIGVVANNHAGLHEFTWTYVVPVSADAHLQTYRPDDLWLIQSVPNYYPDVPVRFLEGEMVGDVSGDSSWLSSSSIRTNDWYGVTDPMVAFAQDKDGHPFLVDGYHGEWNADGGYVGFAVGSGIDRNFGWMHFENLTGQTLTLTGWAYNDVAGDSIQAGEIGASTVVPGTGGLACLGAIGMGRRRRRR